MTVQHDPGPSLRVRWGRCVILPVLAAALTAAAPMDGPKIVGRVLYGKAKNAQNPAVVDIVSVFNHDPVYMHMRALGLSETEPRAKQLFAKAQAETRTALARAARDAGVDVITVLGGVKDAPAAPPDLTQKVIGYLPPYYVHGKVLHGRAQGATRLAEVNSQTVLAAIPAWRESRGLNENDARYYLLRKRYLDALAGALKKVAREGGYQAVVEKGGVTSRVGPLPDLTSMTVTALQP